ncbi:MAG TPA: lysophospholipid acyltransferase family protein, partial [Rhodospirillales bacterium]
VAEMWDNLGRVLGEFPHIETIVRKRVQLVGEEHLEAVRRDGTACIFFSGHLANWELFPLSASHVGVPCVLVYRAVNNPLIDTMLRRIRRFGPDDMLAKGPGGARGAVKALKAGRRLGMLVDQKMNDGIPAPFFGRDVMTAPALAELALRFGCPVVPARVTRLKGARFKLTILPPLQLIRTGDHRADVAANMAQVNALLEKWIRETPEQWLWLHNRWPD